MKYGFFVTLLLTVLLLELIIRASPLIGALAYFIVIAIALIVVSKLNYKYENQKKIILLVAAVCAVKTTILFLPFNLFWKTLAAYALLIFISLFYISGLNTSKKEIKVRDIFWAVSVTVILGYAGSILVEFEKNILLLTLIPLIAISEEYFFRGLLLNSAERESDEESAVIFSSLFYGILGLGLGILPAFFFFTMSLLFGLFYTRVRSLLFTMVLNAIAHIFLFAGSV